MTGLFSRIGALFGGAKQGQDGGRRDEETVVYQDLRICPTPIPEGGQWRLAAAIVKGTGDDAVEYELVRADVFSSRDDAVSFAVRKAKQVIDEQGERLFDLPATVKS
jgi:hypothetical protein